MYMPEKNMVCFRYFFGKIQYAGIILGEQMLKSHMESMGNTSEFNP